MSTIISDNTEYILNAMQKELRGGLEAVGLTAESYSKQLCPVDISHLMNSITHVVDDD